MGLHELSSDDMERLEIVREILEDLIGTIDIVTDKNVLKNLKKY